MLRAQIWKQSPDDTETLRAIVSEARTIGVEAGGRLKATADEVARQAVFSIERIERAASRAEAPSEVARTGGEIPARPIPYAQTVGPTLIISVIAGALMLIGSIGPWATVLGGLASVSGTSGSNDGWLTIICAIATLVAAWRWFASASRGAGVAMLLAGALGTIVAFADRNNVTSKRLIALQVGWGLNLVLGASIVAAVSGLRMTFGMVESKDTVTIGSDEPSAAPSSTPAATVTKPIAERLGELAELREKNLITEEEYDAKRSTLLADV